MVKVPAYASSSTYAPADGVRLAASGAWPARVVAGYAASTLELDRPFEGLPTPARAVVGKILFGGALIPPPPALARAAGAGGRAPAFLRAAHWSQAACWLSGGLPTAIDADFPELGLTRAASRAAAAAGLADLAGLWGRIAALYGEAVPPLEPLGVSSNGLARRGWLAAGARLGAQAGAARPELGRPSRIPARADAAVLRALLERLLGHAAFRTGQLEGVAALLGRRDAVVALPTAGGKSVIFRLAGLLIPGVSVIVEPLTALAREQQRALTDRGLGAHFFIVSPERFESAAFRDVLRAAVEENGAGLLAFDEAHCASAWGHDFRPAYAALGARARPWLSDETGAPVAVALTGTASPRALKAAAAELRLRSPFVVRGGSARPELSFRVERFAAGDAFELLARALERRRPGPGSALVFCPRVDGPRGAVETARRLSQRLGLRAGVYTGRPPEGCAQAQWETDRARAAAALRAGELDALCCTTAFSLGVDVPGVRLVARLGLPDSIEALFQEAGRAGRTGAACECLVFARVARPWAWARRLAAGRPLEELRAEAARLAERDDARDIVDSHLLRFPGEALETAEARALARRLGPWGGARRARLALDGRSPGALARALARFERAGAARIAGFRDGIFEVDLGEEWSAAAAEQAACEQTRRVYAELEPARRGSLAALILAVCAEDPGAALGRGLTRLAEHEPVEELEVAQGGAAPGHVLGHGVAARLGELVRLIVETARAGHALR